MTIDIDKIMAEPEFTGITIVGYGTEKFISHDQARALAERVMAEQREIDAKICQTIEDKYGEDGAAAWFCYNEIRSQQPASEPDTRESREDETDKHRTSYP